MSAARKTKVQVALDYAKPMTNMLTERNARCMEQVLDKKYGLVFERWLLPNGVGVVMMASPVYRELFIESAPRTNSWDATEGALNAAAGLADSAVVAALKDATAYVELYTGNGVQEQPSQAVRLENGDFNAELIAKNGRAALKAAKL